MILNPHTVEEILREPRKMKFKLDHIELEYWSVAVMMRSHKGKSYQSAVTFDTLDKAIKLKVGDTFLR